MQARQFKKLVEYIKNEKVKLEKIIVDCAIIIIFCFQVSRGQLQTCGDEQHEQKVAAWQLKVGGGHDSDKTLC